MEVNVAPLAPATNALKLIPPSPTISESFDLAEYVSKLYKYPSFRCHYPPSLFKYKTFRKRATSYGSHELP